MASAETESIDAREDWNQLRQRIAVTPEDATIRGMFPAALLRATPQLDSPRPRYLAFSNYPLREYMELILQAGQLTYPKLSAANAVFRIGLHVFPLFAATMAGETIFGFAQLDPRKILEYAPRSYGVTLQRGELTLTRLDENEAVLELRDIWNFPDIFHPGVFIGAMQSVKTSGSVVVTRHSPCDVDFLVRWTPQAK